MFVFLIKYFIIKHDLKKIKIELIEQQIKKVKNELSEKQIQKYNLCTMSEIYLIDFLKKSGFSDENIFYNLYVKKNNNNEYSQIDVLLVCEIGIICFEVKDYKGYIYGGTDEKHWTHCFNNNKYEFYNPIKQNISHIISLKKYIRNIPIFNIVVFYGNCQLVNTKFFSSKICLCTYDQIEKAIVHMYLHNKKIKYQNIDELKILLNKFMENAKDKNIVQSHIEYIEHIKNN